MNPIESSNLRDPFLLILEKMQERQEEQKLEFEELQEEIERINLEYGLKKSVP